MKNALSFLRSMRFGLLLLVPVLLCSVLGSLIPQGESETVYAEAFPSAYHLILGLGLDRVFRSPVFLALTALFGLNLTLCCFSQFRAVPDRAAAVRERALRNGESTPLTEAQRQTLTRFLRRGLWRSEQADGKTVYSTVSLSWYGSAVVHFALLGILLAAAGICGLSRSADHALMPGDNSLPGGLAIRLEAFRVSDSDGRVDYASTVEITGADGRKSGLRDIRVNHPLRFGGVKLYQHSYGAAGVLSVTVKETGEVWPVRMTEPGMISVGGTDGVWYMTVYPGHVTDGEGNVIPITQTTGEYPDPLYCLLLAEGGVMTPALAVPGDEVETADAVYRLEAPELYPVLRVKTTPLWIYALLYLSFAALVAGLYLCFFRSPAVVVLSPEGYSLTGKRSDTEWRQRLRLLTESGGEET